MAALKDILLSDLLLDVQNPRLEIQSSQRDALRAIAATQEKKLVKLAQDIVDNGINLSDLPIVTPLEDDKERYEVLEGNRRIAVLKILTTPDLVSGAIPPYLEKQFKQLAQKFEENLITSLTCVIFDLRPEAEHWIELRHTGQNEGAGIVPWEATERARFAARRGGKKSPQLQVLDFVKERGNLSDDTRSNLDSGFAISTLQRLIEDADVQEKLGVEIVQGEIQTKYDDDEVLKGLTKVVEDIASQKIKVPDVYTKDQRLNYIKSLNDEDLPNLPAPQRSESQPLGTATDASGSGQGKPATSATTTRKRSRPSSRDRKTLIPKSCVLNIPHNRINNIYLELRKLKIDDYPNAVATLFRVFIELTLDEYINKRNLKSKKVNEGTSLSSKIQAVVDYLNSNNLMEEKQLVPLSRAISDENSLLSPTTLNGYIHNRRFSPIPGDLVTSWDNLQPFVESIWSK